jgi:hypothetical protein
MSPHQRMLIPLAAVEKFRVIRSAGSTAAGSGVYGMDGRSVVTVGVVCCSSVATAAAWTPCAGTRRHRQIAWAVKANWLAHPISSLQYLSARPGSTTARRGDPYLEVFVDCGLAIAEGTQAKRAG